MLNSASANTTTPEIDYTAVEKAAARLSGVAHRTPVLQSRSANDIAAAQLYFKCENLQRAGAFKFRGAYNAIAALSSEQRARGVVTYSSGNHAQAIALAGSLQKVATTIIMPTDAPEIKVRATRGYGGNILTYDRYKENREAIGSKLAAERGLTLIPPYDHPEVIAGQGTAAKELLEDTGPLDVLFVCLGGGGLLAGSALSCNALSATTRVIGVEPEAGNDGQQSLRAGRVIEIPVPRSIADGAVVTHLGAHNFPIIQRHVREIVTVSDAELVSAMKFFAERMKLIVEPTGCLAAAAAFSRLHHQTGDKVGVILSGGNVDLERFAKLTG
jgi:threo-3-hydroxy-L-aspartate ammonia-lyase